MKHPLKILIMFVVAVLAFSQAYAQGNHDRE